MRADERKSTGRLWLSLLTAGLGVGLTLAACSQLGVGTGKVGSATPAAKVAVAKPPTQFELFQHTVQPFLEQHCYDCHGDDDAENGVRLDLFDSEAALAAGSPTLEKALRNLTIHKMPPRDEPQPTLAEATPALNWLRTYLAGDPSAPINPGRVTIRRLNRAEYNNTIRDLLAVDFQPADAFPVDDAGYGFDNNGDVLSLAPVLMEKYLTAAGEAVDKAILCDPVVPPPLQRWDAATAEGTIPKCDPKATLGGGGPAPLGAQRRAMPLGRVFNSKGAIYADCAIPADGDYVLRVRAYGTQGTIVRQRPKVAFQVDGVQVQQPFTIVEDQRNTSVYALEKTHLRAGPHRITLVMLNGPTPEEAAMAAILHPPPPPKTEAQLEAEEAAAVAAENAAEAAALAAASNPPAPGGAPGAGRRPGAGRGGAKGRPPPGFGGPPPSPTGKPTLGVIYFEAEGPEEITPDRMPASFRQVMVAQPSATETKAQAAEAIIRRFATRAFRRPVRDEEVARLMALWTRADADGRPFEQSVDLALQGVLVSPAFLFRTELDPQPGELGRVHTLNEYELASRMSYFLWSSMPDDELFALAAKGQLRANLSAQIRRMLKDPKSSALIDNFAGQWLQLRAMDNVAPDPATFPDFDEALRSAMTKETQLFFNAIVQEDRSVLDFIDADFTFVNGRLAKHYGIPGVTGEEFQRVSLAGSSRGGVITQASVLTITSYPARTSPVQRGKWVLENLLDAAPPPPPPNVPALAEGKELTGTLRHRMEEHRSNPACAACHAQMDGIGFALENFDATGAWRTQDASHDPIDAAGTLPGGVSFNGPVELRRILLDRRDEFVDCLVGKMLTFALGRGLESYDRRTTDAIAAAMKRNGDRFSVLIEQIVRSEAFQKRNGRPKEPDPSRTAGGGAQPAGSGGPTPAAGSGVTRTNSIQNTNDGKTRGDS